MILCLIVVCIKERKREQSTSLTYLEVLGITYHLKRVNAHAERRELSTSVLGDSSNSPIIQIQESKVDVQSYVLMSVLCYHTQLLFHYYYFVFGNRTKRNLCANILNFHEYRAGFEKNLCFRSEILLNRGQNVQGN